MKIYRSFWVGLASLAVVACGNEDKGTQADETDAAETDVVPVGGDGRPATISEAVEGDSNVAVWEVGDDDTKVYLVGTIHLMQPGVRWKSDTIENAFAQADAVFLEADTISKEAQRAMGVIVTQTAENEGSITLSSYYDKKQKDRVNKVLEGMGMSLSKIDTYRPWFASLQMAVVAMIEAGADPAFSADMVIAREMLERDKPLRYLETAAQQMAILAEGDDQRDAAYFLDLLDDLEEGETYYADMMDAWYSGDTERLEYVLHGVYEDYPRLKERLLTDRNLDWSQQIDRLMTDEPGTFVVAVSAAHMLGEESLQKQLANRGYNPVRL